MYGRENSQFILSLVDRETPAHQALPPHSAVQTPEAIGAAFDAMDVWRYLQSNQQNSDEIPVPSQKFNLELAVSGLRWMRERWKSDKQAHDPRSIRNQAKRTLGFLNTINRLDTSHEPDNTRGESGPKSLEAEVTPVDIAIEHAKKTMNSEFDDVSDIHSIAKFSRLLKQRVKSNTFPEASVEPLYHEQIEAIVASIRSPSKKRNSASRYACLEWFALSLYSSPGLEEADKNAIGDKALGIVEDVESVLIADPQVINQKLIYEWLTIADLLPESVSIQDVLANQREITNLSDMELAIHRGIKVAQRVLVSSLERELDNADSYEKVINTLYLFTNCGVSGDNFVNQSILTLASMSVLMKRRPVSLFFLANAIDDPSLETDCRAQALDVLKALSRAGVDVNQLITRARPLLSESELRTLSEKGCGVEIRGLSHDEQSALTQSFYREAKERLDTEGSRLSQRGVAISPRVSDNMCLIPLPQY